jgi:hypothetical protein
VTSQVTRHDGSFRIYTVPIPSNRIRHFISSMPHVLDGLYVKIHYFFTELLANVIAIRMLDTGVELMIKIIRGNEFLNEQPLAIGNVLHLNHLGVNDIISIEETVGSIRTNPLTPNQLEKQFFPAFDDDEFPVVAPVLVRRYATMAPMYGIVKRASTHSRSKRRMSKRRMSKRRC